MGQHPINALSVAKIKSLNQPGRYSDGNGLYLVVQDSGSKNWIIRTVVQGRRRDFGLGGFPLTTLAEAREKALAYRKMARSGLDPLAEKRAALASAGPTFEEAARSVHAEHLPSWKNEKHAAQWINTLVEYVFPKFGEVTVDKVESSHVLRALSPIWLAKPETARRVRQRIGTVLDWAKAAGYRSGDNPIDGIEKGLPKQSGKKDHHEAMPYEDVPAFVKNLRTSAAGEAVRLGLEFAILTAARTGEVIGATWDEIDLENRVWTIPADRMKAGNEHRVPLSARAVEILTSAPSSDARAGYIFPGSKPDKPLSNMAFLMALRRMEIPVTAHGFRSSFRDWAAEETHFPTEVCEMALAHTVKNKVEAAYRRGDLFEKRRELMEAWAGYCHV